MKKKNTYIVQLTGSKFNPESFKYFQKTPLIVLAENSKKTQAETEWGTSRSFPNPGANIMVATYQASPKWREIAGEKLASTIVEYLDKKTGEPVLVLYPTGHVESLVSGVEWQLIAQSRLNHASRQDFHYQLYQVRTPKIEQFNAWLKQKQK